MTARTILRTTAIAVAALLWLGTAAQAQGIVHRVSVGSSDIDPDVIGRRDANFSLIAIQDAKGNVKGQYQDTFQGGEGIHADVTQLRVIGNVAIIGGVIKNSTTAMAGYQVGNPICAFVQDDDVAGDKISYTFAAPFSACNNANPFNFLLPIGGGQVSVK